MDNSQDAPTVEDVDESGDKPKISKNCLRVSLGIAGIVEIVFLVNASLRYFSTGYGGDFFFLLAWPFMYFFCFFIHKVYLQAQDAMHPGKKHSDFIPNWFFSLPGTGTREQADAFYNMSFNIMVIMWPIQWLMLSIFFLSRTLIHLSG